MLVMETNFDIYSSTVNDQTFDRRDLDYRRGEIKLSKSCFVCLLSCLITPVRHFC